MRLFLILTFFITTPLYANNIFQIDTNWKNVGGIWEAQHGPIVFTVDGHTVKGLYKNGDWILDLEYSSDKQFLFGSWDHQNGLRGPIALFLDTSGSILYGKWGHSGAPSCEKTDFKSCPNIWAIHEKD